MTSLGDFAIGVDVGGNVDVYANIQTFKLCAHQRAHTASPNDARLERACGDRHAIPNPQSGLFIIQNADLRVLEHLLLLSLARKVNVALRVWPL